MHITVGEHAFKNVFYPKVGLPKNLTADYKQNVQIIITDAEAELLEN